MFTKSALKFVRPTRFQSVFCFAKYVQKSKEEIQTELETKRFNLVRNSITSALKNKQFLSVPEWKTLATEMKTENHLRTIKNLDRTIFSALLSLRPPNDSLQNARHFIEASNISHDLSTKRIFIELYAKKASETKLTDEEEKDLIQICDEFIAQEFHVFPEMNSKIVQGLCASKDWKKALSLSNQTVISLNILVRKALRENEIGLTWELLEKLSKLSTNQMTHRTIISFAKYFQKNQKSISTDAEKLLTFCESMENIFNEESIQELTRALQNSKQHAKITNIDYSGVCSVCNSTLDAVKISKKDFVLVKNAFMNKVVKGEDIYRKTTPEEWQRFERVIHDKGPFDIIMDGLNVSYLANKNNFYSRGRNKLGITQQLPKNKQKPDALSLANAVQQLVDEGNRVLVIGRKHMERWPRMNSIHQNASVFLVENISKDDIFMLYAALYSGPNCYILSNDFMRQHKFAIGRRIDTLFKIWQQEHWYGFTIGAEKPIDLIKPMQFKMYCHKVGNNWHLPFKSDKEIELNTWSYYELPRNWACIQLKTK